MELDINNVQDEVVVIADDPLPVPVAAVVSNPVVDALHENLDLAAVLDRDPSLLNTAWTTFLAARAPGTVRSYTSTVNRFKTFCEDRILPFPQFSSDSLLQFILEAVRSNAAYICTIKPALSLLETAMQRPSSFTPYMTTLLAGAKRRRRAAAGPVRKASPLPLDNIQSFFDRFIVPSLDQCHLINAAHFRLAFRLLIEFHTVCRFSCFAKLRAKHFERVGNDILITFPSAKNDQMHEGRTSCLVATGTPYCPVRLATLYFRRFGLTFGSAAGDASFVNFQVRRAAGTTLPIKHKTLSYTTATEDLRAALRSIGVDPAGISDKSVKMSGVTAAFAAGASTEEVMHLGRWQTPAIPLQYKLNTFRFKKNIARNISSLDTAQF
jgi:hypothetical protein